MRNVLYKEQNFSNWGKFKMLEMEIILNTISNCKKGSNLYLRRRSLSENKGVNSIG